MQRSDRTDEDEGQKSRSASRRSSASLSRRNSVREKEVKKSPMNSSSANTTPKKVIKPQNFEFVVTGKQILRRCDRANSLPGTGHRRPSVESAKTKRPCDSPKKTNVSQSSKSQETSLEDDMSLDLSQVSDFEDTNSKYGVKQKFKALATSTPKKAWQKTRSCSLQNAMQAQKVEGKRHQMSLESRLSRDTFRSKDSLYRTSSSSPYRYGTELDYSSVSPEYSGQSSADLSPRASRQTDMVATPLSQDLHVSSCCVSTWQDCSEMENTKIEDCRRHEGEWTHFWANYNNSVATVPMKCYYDQCPTPYRTETIDFADFDLSTDGSRVRSPEKIKNINNIIRNEGLRLTPRETQNMIKCAHILGNVLTKAIERRSREKETLEQQNAEPEREIKKKTMTLDLRETNVPLEVKEEKRCETVTTQTDISLPNTKSAPKIFESILRQLSKSSIDVPEKKEKAEDVKEVKEVKNEN